MEKEVQIKTPDKKIIFGILRGVITKPLIVLVHGLCDHKNAALHYNAARYFEKQGFSSFRFNLYAWKKGARKLHECTLQTHGNDIDTILSFLKNKGARKIFIVGHSYGLPSILHSKNKNTSAVVGWDGSHLPNNFFDKLPKVQKPVKGRILDEGFLTIMGEKMAQEAHKGSSAELLKKLQIPIKFITVDTNNDGNLAGNQRMFKEALVPKKMVIIKGARHNFTEEGAQEKLYTETIKWFKKYA